MQIFSIQQSKWVWTGYEQQKKTNVRLTESEIEMFFWVCVCVLMCERKKHFCLLFIWWLYAK